MPPREIVWKEEHALRGWGCSNCEFIVFKPQPGRLLPDYVKELIIGFGKHDCAALWFVKTKRAELSMQEALCLDGSSYMAWSSSTESVLETSGRGSTAEIQAGIALGS